jgi:hypothetical protein
MSRARLLTTAVLLAGMALPFAACGSGGTHDKPAPAPSPSAALGDYATADELLAAVEAQGIECGKRASRDGLRPAVDGLVCVRPENTYNWMTIRVSMFADAADRDEGAATLAENADYPGDFQSVREAYKMQSWLAGKDWIVEVTDYAVDDALVTVNQLAETIGGVPNLGGDRAARPGHARAQPALNQPPGTLSGEAVRTDRGRSVHSHPFEISLCDLPG